MPIRFQKSRPRARHFIGAWRRYRALTQEQVADRLGMNKASISRIESGKTPYTQDVLETLAEVLATDPASLLSHNPASEDDAWILTERLRRLPKTHLRQALAVIEALDRLEQNDADGAVSQ